MRKSVLRLYAPFLGVVLIQALFIAFLPSTGRDDAQLSTGLGTGQGGPTVDAQGNLIDPETGEIIGAAGGGAAAGGVTGVSAAGGTAGAAAGNPLAIAQKGDISHCTKDGRQFALLYNAPVCKPKWPKGANNGGTTHQGVTAETIKVVNFSAKPNEAVNAILATQGLAQTKEETAEMQKAAFEFIHKYYELYGRRIEVVNFEGDCPTTPPDEAKCLAAAREVLKMKPFMVVYGSPLYQVVFDEWARNGIVAIGGWHFDNKYIAGRRPFRWDVFMDGTQSADHIAEYYCKKMAKKNASHSGRVIHNSFPNGGQRGLVPRKLGIITPELEANVAAAKRVQELVRSCEGGTYTPLLITYESDIERAQEQTDATTQSLIENKITTVTCMCDPIAPVFGTAGFTQQRYFPENLLPGLGLLDYDKLGRLYDSQQRVHMFGPSHLQEPVPHSQSDAAKVWKATGRSGDPCASCNLNWAYQGFVASLIHNAGPLLSPVSIEQEMLKLPPRGGWRQTGGRPEIIMVKFGKDDYTAISDVREAYWSETAVSKIDGQTGAYLAVNGGRRYELGEWDSSLTGIPVAAN